MKTIAVLTSVLLLAVAPTAHAVIIEAQLFPLGGDTYRYEYAVTNDGTAAIHNISILFDPALYDEPGLTIVSGPAIAATWDELLLASGVGIDAAYDATTFGTGILPGATLGGFAVEFDWIGGIAGPAVQPFEIYDPLNFFELLETGTTTVIQPVPEPPSLPLIAIALAMLLYARRDRRVARGHWRSAVF